ncbi:MAG: FGGY family carbohydrate kinase [Thermoplasmatales archaeon]
MEYVIGIDIGSTSTKGILADIQNNVICEANRFHRLYVNRDGLSEADAWDYFKEVIEVIHELIQRGNVSPNKILSISLSGFESVTFIGKNDVSLKTITYLDSRATKTAEEFYKKIDPKDVFEHTGNRASSIFEGYKTIWAFENTKLKEKTVKIADVAKFSVLQLTGKLVMDKSTAMLFAPFYNKNDDQWDTDLTVLSKVPVELLPEIKESFDVAGPVTKDAAEKYGLSERTNVTVGAQDAYSSLLGDGVISSGSSSFIYGTSGVFDLVHKEKRFSDLFANTRHVVPGLYVAEAAMYNAGSLLDWFSRISGIGVRNLDVKVEKRRRPGEIIALPFFTGERAPIWNNDLKGTFTNVSFSNDLVDFYLSLMEGIGYWLRYSLEKASEIGYSVMEIVASGGGSKSTIWPQIVSDIIGRNQIIKVSKGAASGDIFIALRSENIIKDFSEVSRVIDTRGIVKASRKIYENYSKKYRVFLDLLTQKLEGNTKYFRAI